jgi:hypothetical protein
MNVLVPVRKRTDALQALKSVYVNIFDLIDQKRNPNIEARRFKSYQEFRQYTCEGHVFPKKLAKQEEIVKVLLKTI